MANLEFYDKHNIVAFLKKPQGSKDFNQIVDFLNASQIRYALTENPTIYVSLINQFGRTTSARTLDNGEIELNITVYGQDKTITEASVRRHLKLADADGISTLPTTESFEQLALMGLEEEVYVCQPPGFKDPDDPDKLYKMEKVLCVLHQAPRAWYETMAKYLLDNGFHRGKIDQTLFIKRQKEDILLV
nr:putative ribonuclease H-like domain-containing protein [Tanacetum cinerariifolium]